MKRASKNFISNLKKQKRENKSLLFLDNVKIIKDSLAKGVIVPQCILTSMSELPFDAKTEEVYLVDEKIIDQLADTKTPQKVLCIAYLTQYVVEKPKSNFLVLDGLQDPGNVGTLIRTAFASGFEYVYLVNSVRKNNSKLIRSSVGAVFDSKVFEMTKEDFIEFVKKHKLKLICTDMNGENIFEYADKHQNSKSTHNLDCVGVVVGNEGQGVSAEIEKLCFKTVKIPMKAGIESLNAGVSGSIIMYELNKHRI